jgi:hypothetical protein
MGKLYSLPLMLLSMVVLFLSCSKQSQEDEVMVTPPAGQVINATIELNKTYELNLKDYEQADIYTQAVHFLVSRTEGNKANSSFVYKYAPAADFIGTDQVVLKTVRSVKSQSNNGSSCHNNNSNDGSSMSLSTTYLTIKFNVKASK